LNDRSCPIPSIQGFNAEVRRKRRAYLRIGDCFEKEEVETMSVAFTREESAETAAEVELPDRPISPHPNLVTASGLEALATAMAEPGFRSEAQRA
jgi:hypothetical protein